ncbi:MAG: hypothetical protein JWM50_1125 [Microbacteriaceae bacterium]|jgi:hypothetical protein|nr:hypothetical protein [Microbacteriaceae bacterium]
MSDVCVMESGCVAPMSQVGGVPARMRSIANESTTLVVAPGQEKSALRPTVTTSPRSRIASSSMRRRDARTTPFLLVVPTGVAWYAIWADSSAS